MVFILHHLIYKLILQLYLSLFYALNNVVQETTAAFLSAALAKQAASGSSEVHEQVRVGTGVSTSTTDGATIAVDAGRSLHSETKENVNSNNDSSKVNLFFALVNICFNIILFTCINLDTFLVN